MIASPEARTASRAQGRTVRFRDALDGLALDRSILAAVVASRFVVLVGALVAEALPGRNPALTSGDGAPILASLTSWDGWWYLGIVRDGYHAAPIVDGYFDYAFLPLYPALVRLLSAPWPQLAGLVAVLVSNVAFVVGLGLLVRVGEIHLGRERARLAAVCLALFPFSWVFSMAYTESVFLVLSLGAFLAAERDRRALSGVLLALAALTRLQGAALVVPLWVLLYLRDDRRFRRSQAWLLLGPMAAAAFLLFVVNLTGTVAGYSVGQAAWGRTGPSLVPSGGSIVSVFSVYQGALVAVLCVAVFMLVYLRPDRIPLPYALVPIIYLGLEFSSGSLEAVARILMLAFPYLWILANRRAPWFRAAWPIASTALLGVTATVAFSGWWVP